MKSFTPILPFSHLGFPAFPSVAKMLPQTTFAVLVGILMSRYILGCESVIKFGDRFENNTKYNNHLQFALSFNRLRGLDTRALDPAFDPRDTSNKANIAGDDGPLLRSNWGNQITQNQFSPWAIMFTCVKHFHYPDNPPYNMPQGMYTGCSILNSVSNWVSIQMMKHPCQLRINEN